MMSSIILQSILACGPKDAPVETTVIEAVPSRQNDTRPEPLEAPSFTLPVLEEGKLSNGIPVRVSTNTETPLVTVQIVLKGGEWNTKNPTLANATMDMLTEGAGEMDAAGLSAAQRKLAASISADAGLDGSRITLSALKKKLDDSLALLDIVVSSPTFPEDAWSILQQNYQQQLIAEQQDPNSIARNVFNSLMYTGQYAGQMGSADNIAAVSPTAMKEWYTQNVSLANASIYVGGDTTLDEVLPLLENHFVDFPDGGGELGELPNNKILAEEKPSTVYFVDSPGASQSVIYAGQFVSERTSEEAEELYLANMAIGGFFIARINMNLREDKGWTYGARSGISYNHLPGLFKVRTSVVAEHTADSLSEILKELRDSQDAKPITQDELNAGRGYILGTDPLRYENPSYLLSQMIQVERYGLPTDWYTTYNDRLRSVTLEDAQTVWNGQIDPNELTIVIVGDAASQKSTIEELGLSVVDIDSQGNPFSKESETP